jgi:hypothetical protein
LDDRLRLIESFLDDPCMAHDLLFEARHPQKTPPFHYESIKAWWSTVPRIGEMAFRGAAKSTRAEEALAAMAGVRFFKYALIVGNSETRAVERLSAIKHEMLTNERYITAFGDLQGPTWNDAEILLANGVMIKAFGARQSMRGAKHWDQRPDMLFVDDVEDEDNVSSKEQRDKLFRWFWRSLIPACEPDARIRIAGTPLHPESLLERLRKESGWPFPVYPIVMPAVTEPQYWVQSNWPGRYPLEKIREIRDSFAKVGDLEGFVQEYLCQSEEPALKVFQTRHIVRAPTIPAWAPSMVVVDPSRTTRVGKSARTGYVVFSWLGSKCYVRAAYGAYHQPDQIIDETFKLDRTFSPVKVGVEKDGLEEFLMQPYRQAILKTGQPVPLTPLNAPRDRNKTRFISGLQVFFEAGDILMCDDFPDLFQEMDGFPRGMVDVLNALAYAPQLRGGRPVYDDFGLIHVMPELAPDPKRPAYLAISARASHSAACLVQFNNGALRVYADWLREGDPTSALEQIIPEAKLAAGRAVVLVAPLAQFDPYNNVGLAGACRRLGQNPTRLPGGSTGALKPFLQKQVMHQPAFLVSQSARWTLNALALGYSYGLDKSGMLKAEPDADYYRTLMEGLEGLAKWLTLQSPSGDSEDAHYAFTETGYRYMTSRPGMPDGRRAQLKR